MTAPASAAPGPAEHLGAPLDGPVRALSLDALGTILCLEPPAPRLRRALAARFGVELDRAAVERAIAAEIAYYRAHHLEGSDPARLDDLRRRCAQVVDRHLPELAALEARAAKREAAVLEALLDAIAFTPYPDALRLLARARQRGVPVVVASNWDCGLAAILAEHGIDRYLRGMVTSAELGAAKPDRRVFEAAARAAGVAVRDLLHVGDDPCADLVGARLAGARAVLVDRHGVHPEASDRVEALDQLVPLLSTA